VRERVKEGTDFGRVFIGSRERRDMICRGGGRQGGCELMELRSVQSVFHRSAESSISYHIVASTYYLGPTFL
jgi:hypothetical protein